MGIWLHLWFVWLIVTKSDEGIFNVSRHGEVHLVLRIVPIKCESQIPRSFPVGVDCSPVTDCWVITKLGERVGKLCMSQNNHHLNILTYCAGDESR